MICPFCQVAADYNTQEVHNICRNYDRTWCDCAHHPIKEEIVNEETKKDS